mmetsp:Transcript_174171/g.552924  ORF Transcript_174171/g.552924 Transcript_174171/m.552924 type:complete len:207 (+) Transcript_174171:468-1088(+)
MSPSSSPGMTPYVRFCSRVPLKNNGSAGTCSTRKWDGTLKTHGFPPSAFFFGSLAPPSSWRRTDLPPPVGPMKDTNWPCLMMTLAKPNPKLMFSTVMGKRSKASSAWSWSSAAATLLEPAGAIAFFHCLAVNSCWCFANSWRLSVSVSMLRKRANSSSRGRMISMCSNNWKTMPTVAPRVIKLWMSTMKMPTVKSPSRTCAPSCTA